MKAYRFLIEARNEFHEHIGYFDSHSLALGDRFIDAVEAAIRDFRRYPEIGSPISRQVRQRVLHGRRIVQRFVPAKGVAARDAATSVRETPAFR